MTREDAIQFLTDTGISPEHIMELVEALSNSEKPNKWIPVSERLPEEYADVICCTDAEEVFLASYLGKLDDGSECFDDNNGMMCEGDVTAWMPLPKPYKQEAEDEN